MSKKDLTRKDQKGGRYVVWTLLVLVAMVLVALLLPLRGRRNWWIWAWIINLILMFVIVGIAGLALEAKGRFWAMFVDSRNMVSLSRFQVVLWTLVVMSAFWTIGLARVGDYWFGNHADRYTWEAPESTFQSPIEEPTGGQEQPEDADLEEEEPTVVGPLVLKLPTVLWALMGISVTSAVASPLIKQDKTLRTEDDQDGYERMLDATLAPPDSGEEPLPEEVDSKKDDDKEPEDENGPEFSTKGAVVYRNQNYEPKFIDLFRGEDPETLIYLDIGKVQNFFFTVVAVVTYALAIGAAIGAAESIASLFEFPDISEGLLAVLGISHGGYLLNKVTNTPAPLDE